RGPEVDRKIAAEAQQVVACHTDLLSTTLTAIRFARSDTGHSVARTNDVTDPGRSCRPWCRRSPRGFDRSVDRGGGRAVSHVPCGHGQSSGKKIPISRSALARLSLPWTRFSVNKMPRSPRMVP